MPNGIVFPGGAIEPSDSDKSWNSIFSSFGISEDKFIDIESIQEKRPSIFNIQHPIHHNDKVSGIISENAISRYIIIEVFFI